MYMYTYKLNWLVTILLLHRRTATNHYIYICTHALYPEYCDMRYKCPWSVGVTQGKYWALKCWTEFELWMYEGSEFQTDENTNVFRYISKWGSGVFCLGIQ